MINFNYKRIQFRERRCHCKLAFCVNFVRREERGRNQLYLCDDEYLHKINLEYLNMMTTDIISFDYTLGNEIHGDIFISVERVQENAADFKVPLKRKYEE
jgi:ssRNA-specific RNase YbeY (16S rRNA maturation enzyme)